MNALMFRGWTPDKTSVHGAHYTSRPGSYWWVEVARGDDLPPDRCGHKHGSAAAAVRCARRMASTVGALAVSDPLGNVEAR